MKIRPLVSDDWPAVEKIYLEGIASGLATFETESPGWKTWDENHHQQCRLVMEGHESIIGWAALLPVSNRVVYNGVAEVSIYISEQERGKGYGRKLLQALINESEAHGFWMLQSVLLVQNIVSYNLHINLGFREVGMREKIAFYRGEWRDTVLLERRSDKI